MTRKRSPRRELLDALRDLKENARQLGWRWDVTGRVYLDPGERTEASTWHRKRREDEYPENSLEELHQAILFAGAIQEDAQQIKAVARQRIAEIRAQEAPKMPEAPDGFGQCEGCTDPSFHRLDRAGHRADCTNCFRHCCCNAPAFDGPDAEAP
jgi:hypothetical protein